VSDLASIETEERGDRLVLRIRGEIDVSNARELSAAIEAAVPNGTHTIVMDLTDITYLDSAGVKVFLQLADRLRARRRLLRLVVPTHAPIRAVLELTGLPRLVPLDDHLEEEAGSP
jgi:anti-sigma B factor antagonist